MSIIHQLSSHVADLIAAGEVVERPGSVVKELLENAVDAGARHITTEIQNGGMTFIRVTDDGCGMAADDAETAFLRHATSKISRAEDLESIATMGFRGEALAAISSVSRIDLLTRADGSDSGVSLRLEGGVVTDRSPAGCPVGTTMIVRDLFYNTPARMKFMKSDAAESSNIFAAVQRQALSHPDVAFRFLRDGQEQLSTPGDGSLESAVYCVFGRQFARDLTPVESRWEKYAIRGFVTKPTASRGNRSSQHFFVNGRPVKSRLLSAALEQAYQNQIMSGRFPGCVLQLDIPAHKVDVNVHPAKTEVRFLSERDVFDAVHYGVLGALSRTPGRPELHLPAAPAKTAGSPPPAAGKLSAAGKLAAGKQEGFFRSMDAAQFRAFAKAVEQAPPATPAPETVRRVFSLPELPEEPSPARAAASPKAAPAAAPDPEPAADMLCSPEARLHLSPSRDSRPELPDQAELAMPETPDYRVVGEVLDTYIIVEQGQEVLFLDKHAAHERILFERLRAEAAELMSQVLIAPLPVQLEREEAAAVLEQAGFLRRFGFEVDDFGGSTVAIRQIPADLDESQAEAVLQELAAQLTEGRAADPASLRDNILHTIACKAAIKAGWHTEPAERDALVRQVLSRDDIKYCPHGRPVCITLTRSQLERQFRRS